MSLNDLAPTNTKRARDGAARLCKAFLGEEGVTWEYLEVCMKRDNAPLILEAVVDKFGLHLAFKEGRKGKLLARHSVMQYFRQAKNWLLYQFPQHRAAVDKALLKKGQMLERYCMKRESGNFVKKSPACTKKALKQMMLYLYSTGVTAADYQDAALLCLLWYLFGRASDISHLRKVNLSIGSAGIFFLRLIRVKTSEEQGLSLFPDEDFFTCPLLAIAVALATQSAPSAALLNHLPEQQVVTEASLTPAAPLIDLIDNPEAVAPLGSASEEDKPLDDTIGIHGYVNRVLARVMPEAGVAERLTSHSFRRGGAQHANGIGMCVQWIFDRGAWNMTATNKAFAYVFNTPAEDHKVARVLSNRGPDDSVSLLSLDVFDSHTQHCIRSVASALFTSSSGMESEQYNVNSAVLDTLMAYLLRHYPALKALSGSGLVVLRLEACVAKRGYTVNDLLAWSAYLTSNPSTAADSKTMISQEIPRDITQHPVFLQQTALIEQLIQVNKKLDARLTVMEDKIGNKHPLTPVTLNKDPSDKTSPVKRRRTSPALSLKDAWFAWYTQEPRMWSSTDSETKHARSTEKLVVAFLKLFLPDGFVLDETSPRYRDDVLETGARAEKSMLMFLQQQVITARGAQNVLKFMRKLHKSGVLNEHISNYQQRQSHGLIVDPAPSHTNDTIGLKPTKNGISSAKEFKTLCIAVAKSCKIRVSDEAIRHLRLTMNATVASTSLLPEAIEVVFTSLTERKKGRASLEDIREWLAPPAVDDEEGGDEDLYGEKVHYMRKILNWKRVNGKTYYLVEWEATWEPREHRSRTVVAAFEKERRLLVRKKFFEDEAVEDNTFN
ncbi:hypothetical protein P3T76_001873 [Phytophthora citrophthora]|uniref:Chromo domain-containing protein n=1 Tax=Phytophthora citrophthora TaxID=4793 RepID=A0AAD9GXG9_9STRA|nr:hypothetical protein P3T76_001873 [Phytophthora citrophthora]